MRAPHYYPRRGAWAVLMPVRGAPSKEGASGALLRGGHREAEGGARERRDDEAAGGGGSPVATTQSISHEGGQVAACETALPWLAWRCALCGCD